MRDDSRPGGAAVYHFWLTRSVARSMGVSLSEAIANGRIQVQDYVDLVSTCRKCAHVTACEKWLSESTHEKGEGPHFCLLLPTLNALARKN